MNNEPESGPLGGRPGREHPEGWQVPRSFKPVGGTEGKPLPKAEELEGWSPSQPVRNRGGTSGVSTSEEIIAFTQQKIEHLDEVLGKLQEIKAQLSEVVAVHDAVIGNATQRDAVEAKDFVIMLAETNLDDAIDTALAAKQRYEGYRDWKIANG